MATFSQTLNLILYVFFFFSFPENVETSLDNEQNKANTINYNANSTEEQIDNAESQVNTHNSQDDNENNKNNEENVIDNAIKLTTFDTATESIENNSAIDLNNGPFTTELR